jgi:hypothetical protein
MGSSILASLSEAGGNDPFDLVSKPLPSHSLDHADRVERNPRLCIMQARGPKRGTRANPEDAGYTEVSVTAASLGATRECRCGNPRPTPEFLPSTNRRAASLLNLLPSDRYLI